MQQEMVERLLDQVVNKLNMNLANYLPSVANSIKEVEKLKS